MTESHGGNIYLLAEKLGIKESEIIDFSASINPLGVPESVKAAMKANIEYLFNYPDPDAKKLRMKIAESTGVNCDSIICGNGSTELIYLLARALRPKNILIPAPTFSEYERALRNQRSAISNQQSGIRYFYLKKENNFDIDADEFIKAMEGKSRFLQPSAFSPQPFNMAFLCNPNNPTGRLIKREDMLKIAEAARKLKCILAVDEAFIDFCPGASIINEVADNPYLIVLRSLTKFYALSGLRVGYAVISSSIMASMKEAKEPWTVNTLAQVAGVAALDDSKHKTRSLKTIEKEKRIFEEGLKRLGIAYFPSAANYYLLEMKKAQETTAFLREKRILVRECSNFIGLDGSYIRVAVKSEKDNIRLLKEISSWAR